MVRTLSRAFSTVGRWKPRGSRWISASLVIARGSPFVAQVSEPVARCLGNAFGVPDRGIAPILYIVEHNPNAVGETYFRMPSQIALDLADVSPCAIRLPPPLRNLERPRAAAHM